MAATKFTAVLPSGETATRSSKTKSYQWAVAVSFGSTWSIWRWSESYAAAAKFARGEQGRGARTEIVEVAS